MGVGRVNVCGIYLSLDIEFGASWSNFTLCSTFSLRTTWSSKHLDLEKRKEKKGTKRGGWGESGTERLNCRNQKGKRTWNPVSVISFEWGKKERKQNEEER